MPDKESLKTCANQTRRSLCISDSMDMRESNEREMGKKGVFSHILQEFRELYSLYTWTFVCIYFITSKRWYFSILFNKKIKDIQEPKPILNTLKAFRSNSLNSRVFKTQINSEVNILESTRCYYSICRNLLLFDLRIAL